MTTTTTAIPFELSKPRSFRGLTTIPLFATDEPRLEYIGFDEAAARGLTISEIGAEGIVGLLAVANPLGEHVLLYEGEELVGAKQNRIVERSLLVMAGSTLKIPVHCVERGRWAQATTHFAPAPRAAYPSLRAAQRLGQSVVWHEISTRATSLDAHSPTEAAEAMYDNHAASLDEYAQALPRLDGQSGVLVGIGGRLACLDYVSRSDVFAGLYPKLLRGYALEALGADERPLSKRAVGRFLGELELVSAAESFEGYAMGTRLLLDGETIALSAFPAR